MSGYFETKLNQFLKFAPFIFILFVFIIAIKSEFSGCVFSQEFDLIPKIDQEHTIRIIG